MTALHEAKVSSAKKKAKKDKKSKKHKKRDDAIDDDVNMVEEDPVADVKTSKKEKKDKKKKKRKLSDASTDDAPAGDSDQDSGDDGHDKSSKKEKKKSLKDKKKAKAELMAKVPQKDEHGISYTKIQIRRMMKRVKRGLPPLETEAEERERRRQDAVMRKEEELELADMLYKKEEEETPKDDDSSRDKGSDNEEDDGSDGESDGDDASITREEDEDNVVIKSPQPPKKKSKRSKPVPKDYVCSACQNKHPEPHWIYDCPDKVTMRGTNQKKKKLRGLHDPDPKKVFVSGLPFDAKEKDVQAMFQACGKVASCRLIKFEDTGRCKGQAYITFDSEKGAGEALKISGTTIDASAGSSDKKKKKKSDASPSKRKELKIKVSKVLNRKVTTRKFK